MTKYSFTALYPFPAGLSVLATFKTNNSSNLEAGFDSNRSLQGEQQQQNKYRTRPR